MTPSRQDCFQVLDLHPGASVEEIKRAYRLLVKAWHPDRFTGDPKLSLDAQEKLKQINLAYERLSKSEALGSGATKEPWVWRPPESMPPRETTLNANDRRTIYVTAWTRAYFCLGSVIFLIAGISTLMDVHAGTFSPDKGNFFGLLFNALPYGNLLGGIFLIVLALSIFLQCRQKLVFEDGMMTYYRPFLLAREVQLSKLTWVGSSCWTSDRYGKQIEFVSGRKLLCSFGSSYFKGPGLAFILEQVRTHSTAVIEPTLTHR
jgi:hypothetical protein